MALQNRDPTILICHRQDQLKQRFLEMLIESQKPIFEKNLIGYLCSFQAKASYMVPMQLIWYKCILYGTSASFMVPMHLIWYQCIFMVPVHLIWYHCILYGTNASYMVPSHSLSLCSWSDNIIAIPPSMAKVISQLCMPNPLNRQHAL